MGYAPPGLHKEAPQGALPLATDELQAEYPSPRGRHQSRGNVRQTGQTAQRAARHYRTA